MARSQGNYTEAHGYYQESLECFQRIDRKDAIVISLINLGAVTYLQGDFKKSYSYYENALEISQNLDYKMVLAHCFDGFAALNFKHNELKHAVKLSGTAEKLRESIGYVMEKEDSRFRDAYLSELKNKMDKTDFSKFYEEGKNLKLEEAIALTSNLQL